MSALISYDLNARVVEWNTHLTQNQAPQGLSVRVRFRAPFMLK